MDITTNANQGPHAMKQIHGHVMKQIRGSGPLLKGRLVATTAAGVTTGGTTTGTTTAVGTTTPTAAGATG